MNNHALLILRQTSGSQLFIGAWQKEDQPETSCLISWVGTTLELVSFWKGRHRPLETGRYESLAISSQNSSYQKHPDVIRVFHCYTPHGKNVQHISVQLWVLKALDILWWLSKTNILSWCIPRYVQIKKPVNILAQLVIEIARK